MAWRMAPPSWDSVAVPRVVFSVAAFIMPKGYSSGYSLSSPGDDFFRRLGRAYNPAMLISSSYADVRDRFRPLDVLAFRGEGGASNGIAAYTHCEVSHVGIVITARFCDGVGADALDGTVVRVMESTSLDGFAGVVESRVSDRLRDYNGRVWWLPLADDVRAQLDVPAALDFLYRQRGKAYDYRQALLSGMDRLDGVPLWNTFTAEDWNRVFCSELVCGGLRAGGVFASPNCSEITPHDVVSAPIFAPDAHQLKGPPLAIRCHRGGRR